MVALPTLEFPKFEMPKFEMPKFEMPKFELPKFELPKFELPKVETDLVGVARDAAYASIGLGVLAAQQVQRGVATVRGQLQQLQRYAK